MRLLLVCPKFYGYERYIKKCFQERYSHVKMFFSNKSEYSYFFKTLIKLFPSKKDNFFNWYFHFKLLGKKKFDALVVIKGDNLSEFFFSLIDYENIPKRSMYQWDSVKNNKNALRIEKYFNRKLTFDKKDADTYGWIYRPLFYMQSLCGQRSKNLNILFNGSLHSQRLQIVEMLKKYNNVYISLLISFLGYIKEFKVQKNKKYIENKEYITLKKLSVKENYSLYSSARVVVDYAHPEQTGLTMRTIEAYGNGCKLVTNNMFIRQEPIYNQDWVMVYDSPEKLYIPDSWLSEHSEHTVQNGYEIHEWANDILPEILYSSVIVYK